MFFIHIEIHAPYLTMFTSDRLYGRAGKDEALGRIKTFNPYLVQSSKISCRYLWIPLVVKLATHLS